MEKEKRRKEMPEDFSTETKAPFNMAISTLESLRAILNNIRRLAEDIYLDDAAKQKLKINLVKRFYVDSSPLLKTDVVERYKSILNIKPKEYIVVKDYRKTNKRKVIFDQQLEEVLDQCLIEIQRELQLEKYFMPPKKDLSRAVSEF